MSGVVFCTMKKLSIPGVAYLITGIVVVGGIVIAGVIGNGGSSLAYTTSALSAIESEYDFGTIAMQDGVVRYAFEVTNAGSETVTIEKAYTSCMCTEIEIENAQGERFGPFGMQGHGTSARTRIEVLAGESVSVEAVFDPAAHGPSGVGFAQRSLYLETNSSVEPTVELAFTATVTR